LVFSGNRVIFVSEGATSLGKLVEVVVIIVVLD